MAALLTISSVLTVVAAVDAARDGHWDQFAMLVAIGLTTVALWFRLAALRDAVRPRTDLMGWVRTHAAETDDEPQLVVDRALAAYRAGILPDPPP